MNQLADPFTSHRKRLLGLAYRMLGSRSDAEDVLQDAYLRFSAASNIDNTEAFLVTVVTRLCLDRLKSARARREVYVGPWLPEPVTDAAELSPATATELAEDLSFALLLAMERLNPAERAAFLLHDVFGLSFDEVATVLDRETATCRQLASRARKSLQHDKSSASASIEAHARLLQEFSDATASGDMTALIALLRHDAVAVSDGGGIRQSALQPIYGADKVVRFFMGLMKKITASGNRISAVTTTINNLPGLLIYINGTLEQTLSIDIEDDKIATIYIVRNPEKLRGLVQVH